MTNMDRWISAQTQLAASVEQATKMLTADPRGLIPSSLRRASSEAMVIDLSLVVGVGTSIRQDVEVRLGVPRSAEGEAWVPISWEPVSHARMLPTFEGTLAVLGDNGSSQLSITGTYRVPLGIVGHFGDGFVGRRVAQQSLRVLVEQVAHHIDERVLDQIAHAAWSPPPYPVDLREGRTPTT